MLLDLLQRARRSSATRARCRTSSTSSARSSARSANSRAHRRAALEGLEVGGADGAAAAARLPPRAREPSSRPSAVTTPSRARPRRRALELAAETGARPGGARRHARRSAISSSRSVLPGAARAAPRRPSSTSRVARATVEPAASRFVVDRDRGARSSSGEPRRGGRAARLVRGERARLGQVARRSPRARAAAGLLARARTAISTTAFGASSEALALARAGRAPARPRAHAARARRGAATGSSRRREARATLEEALALFERIGAALWAERARGELKRISGRAASPGELTPAEERVAALVAEGKTNREVAAALYLSDRTVEGHLSRIFGKLGIRHRTELAPALAARQSQGVAMPNTGDSPVSAAPPAP